MSKDNIFQRIGRRGGGRGGGVGGKRMRGGPFNGHNGQGRLGTWTGKQRIFRTCPNPPQPQSITRTVSFQPPQRISRGPNFKHHTNNKQGNPFFFPQVKNVPSLPVDFQYQLPPQRVLFDTTTIRKTIEPTKPSFHNIIQAMVRLLMKHGAYDRDGMVKKIVPNNGDKTLWNLRQDAEIVNKWQSRQGLNSPTVASDAPNSPFLSTGVTRISRNSRGRVGKTITSLRPPAPSSASLKMNHQPSLVVNRQAEHSSAIGEPKCDLDAIIRKCTGGEHSPFTTYELFDMYNQCIESGINVPIDETDPL